MRTLSFWNGTAPSINHSFLSTSESSIEELIELNYGNCPELGIISFEISLILFDAIFEIHPATIIFEWSLFSL